MAQNGATVKQDPDRVPLSIQQERETYVREDGTTFTRDDIFVKLAVTFRENMLSALRGAKLSVYLCVALHCGGKEMESWPSVPTIAEETGYKERQVQYALRELEGMGLVEAEARRKEDGSRNSNRYKIHGYATMGKGVGATPGAVECTRGGAVECTRVVQPSAPKEETRKEKTSQRKNRSETKAKSDAASSVPVKGDADLTADSLSLSDQDHHHEQALRSWGLWAKQVADVVDSGIDVGAWVAWIESRDIGNPGAYLCAMARKRVLRPPENGSDGGHHDGCIDLDAPSGDHGGNIDLDADPRGGGSVFTWTANVPNSGRRTRGAACPGCHTWTPYEAMGDGVCVACAEIERATAPE